MNTAETKTYGVEYILESLLESGLEQTQAEKGGALLLDDAGQVTRSVCRGLDAGELASHVGDLLKEVAETMTGRVVVSGGVVPGPPTESGRQTGLMSVLAAPIAIDGVLLGILYMDNRLQRRAFNYEDLDRIAGLCRLAAMGIHNLQLG